MAEHKHTNRLAQETSPYLLQHRHNPVDWYPWSPEAFERARADDKPLLLSVGYSACHWCHVMERESFENEEIAALMNRLFVNIKVDREERPDVDQIYMQAVQSMTGHGGWPMTVFLTPDGVPFYGGTYFPPVDRHGMPAFPRLIQGVAEAYRGRRGEVVEAGKQLLEQMGQSERLRSSNTLLTDTVLFSAYQALSGEFDAREGGMGRAPKFPQPMNWEFLLRFWKRTGNARALEMARLTLTKMARGGMYDQLGGGLPSLLGGRAVARAPLREDALRQRPAGVAVPARLARHGGPRVPARLRGDARLHPARDDACLGRLLLGAGRRLGRRRGQVLRLVRGRDPRRAA